MEIINLSIESLNIPPNKEIEFTKYQISTSPTFDDEYIIIEKNGYDDERYSIDIELENIDKIIYYARIKLIFEDGSYYGWSSPILITKDGTIFENKGTTITAPRVSIDNSIENCELGGFIVTCSDFKIFTGDGYHKYTTWRIRDNNNKIIWEKELDKYNLTSIRIPSKILIPNHLHVIEVIYISSNGEVSAPGKLLVKAKGDSRYIGIKAVIAENEDLSEALNYTLTELVNRLALGNYTCQC